MTATPASDPIRPAHGRRVRGISGDDRERAILATAERLLGERQLHEISIDDLARGAGLSRPTFYFYFASKEAVLLSLMEPLVSEALAGRGTALDELAADPRAGWRTAIDAFAGAFQRHGVVAAAAADAYGTNPLVRALWGTLIEGFVADTAAAIESERERGAAPAGIPARDLAISLNWMVERVLHGSVAEHAPSLAPAAVLETLLAIFLGAIYGTPPSLSGEPDPKASKKASKKKAAKKKP